MWNKLSKKARTLIVAGIAAAGVLVVVWIAALVLRVDLAKARETALDAAGGGEVMSQEIDREGFWNEYSFDILNGGVWYEVEVNAFGQVTGLESSRSEYGGWDHWD